MKVNIPKDIDDPFYRYTRIVLTPTYTGTKTIISKDHFAKLASQLYRTSEELISYLKKNLARSITSDKQSWIISGMVFADDLDESIEDYIHEHVLCKKCNLPETRLENKKLKCSACGY